MEVDLINTELSSSRDKESSWDFRGIDRPTTPSDSGTTSTHGFCSHDILDQPQQEPSTEMDLDNSSVDRTSKPVNMPINRATTYAQPTQVPVLLPNGESCTDESSKRKVQEEPLRGPVAKKHKGQSILDASEVSSTPVQPETPEIAETNHEPRTREASKQPRNTLHKKLKDPLLKDSSEASLSAEQSLISPAVAKDQASEKRKGWVVLDTSSTPKWRENSITDASEAEYEPTEDLPNQAAKGSSEEELRSKSVKEPISLSDNEESDDEDSTRPSAKVSSTNRAGPRVAQDGTVSKKRPEHCSTERGSSESSADESDKEQCQMMPREELEEIRANYNRILEKRARNNSELCKEKGDLKILLRELNSELEAWKVKLSATEADLEAEHAKEEIYKASMTSKFKKYTERQVAVEAERIEKAHERNAKRLQGNVDRLTTDVEEAKKKHKDKTEELRGVKEAHKNEVKRLKDKIREVNLKHRKELQDRKPGSSKALKEKDKIIQNLQNNHTRLEEKYKRTKDDLASATKQCSELNTSNETLQTQLKSWTTCDTNFREKLENQARDHKKRMEALHREYQASLDKQQESFKLRLDVAKEGGYQTHDQLRQLRLVSQAKEQVIRENRKLSADLDRVRGEAREVARLKAEMEGLQGENERLRGGAQAAWERCGGIMDDGGTEENSVKADAASDVPTGD